MMQDYSEILDRLSKGLGRAFAQSPMILGVPGTSVAVKIDPHHYIAVMPAFLSRLAEWAGVFPDTARDALARTGNLVRGADGSHQATLTVVWGDPPVSRRINAAFLLAGFVDHALKLYGGHPAPMPVADLYIDAEDREIVNSFFKGITSIDKTAFTRPV